MVLMSELVKKDDAMSEEQFTAFKTFLTDAEAVQEALPANPELDDAIDRMVARWMNSTKIAFVAQALTNLKLLCKKIYYHRLKTRDSRGCWDMLKSNIL